mgnify:CR=1 FL=1
MYLRQSNKWNEWLLQEAVEDIGLPPAVAHFLRQQNEEFGPVDNKHLTWIGQLVKEQRQDLLLSREQLMEIRRHLQQAVRTTLEKRDVDWVSNKEVFGELFAEALAPLMEFRDEREKQSPNIADIKKFKKRFIKNLKRLEIERTFIKGFDSYVDNRLVMGVRTFFMKSVKPIMLLLAEDPQSYNDLREESGLQMAGIAAEEILANHPKAEEQVIHEFDNGYFWYDIRSHHCDFEAKKMGHCGRGEQGSLVSLRSGEGRRVKPMITMEFDGTTLYQIKGKANKAPKKDLWPYIDWFIENMGVERVTEMGMHSDDAPGFMEMMTYLAEKHEDVKFKESWTDEADELLNQFEPTIDTDSQTFLELDYASEGGDGEVGVVLRHQAFWPVKDVIVDEETHRLTWEIKQDAQAYADDTLYPNPRVESADVFARGVQDSQAAMLRIELYWSDSFEPEDIENEEHVKHELERLLEFLDEIQHISKWLVSSQAAPEDAEFDYNEFHEKVQKRLEAYGVYRDLAGEIDAEDEIDKSGQLDLPLQESRIIQRWSKIIK